MVFFAAAGLKARVVIAVVRKEGNSFDQKCPKQS